jgi:hypothetical protein
MLRCQTGEATRSEYQNRKKLAGEEAEACVQESRRGGGRRQVSRNQEKFQVRDVC